MFPAALLIMVGYRLLSFSEGLGSFQETGCNTGRGVEIDIG